MRMMKLKCLQRVILPLEKEQFNILITMALQCGPLDVLQRQRQPYLTDVLSNPTEEMLNRSQGAPMHNMHSEQTLALFNNRPSNTNLCQECNHWFC